MPLRAILSRRPQFQTCSVCNEAVEVKTSKVNELGRLIHEDCYALKEDLKKATTTVDREASIDSPVVREVLEFLNVTRSDSATNVCPTCGSKRECRNSTFLYRGQSWDIPLRICIRCCLKHTPPKRGLLAA